MCFSSVCAATLQLQLGALCLQKTPRQHQHVVVVWLRLDDDKYAMISDISLWGFGFRIGARRWSP